jgi:hypothetical protein
VFVAGLNNHDSALVIAAVPKILTDFVQGCRERHKSHAGGANMFDSTCTWYLECNRRKFSDVENTNFLQVRITTIHDRLVQPHSPKLEPHPRRCIPPGVPKANRSRPAMTTMTTMTSPPDISSLTLSPQCPRQLDAYDNSQFDNRDQHIQTSPAVVLSPGQRRALPQVRMP